MRELYADACLTVVLDPATRMVRCTRSDVPYASNAHLAATHAQIARALDALGRERHTLLVDLRRAPLNNDPSFEKASERARPLLLRGFPRVAVLVQTAVGALQVKRHLREDGLPIPVLGDEAQAIDFLLGKVELEDGPASGVGPLVDGPFNHLSRRTGRR